MRLTRFNSMTSAMVLTVAMFDPSIRALADAADVAADTGSSIQLEEITITAQRQSQNLQRVPIAVSAISATELENSGVTDSQAIANVVPGLTFSTNGPSGTIFIRGVGSNAGNVDSEPSVALYVDDVYIASPTGNQFSFNNIDQIAVLKGPQGTLFGRNATGGVIQITTRDPGNTPALDVEGGYSNYDTYKGSVYASTPVAANLAADIAIIGQDQGDGWGHNLTRGDPSYIDDDIAARSKWGWTPDDATKVRLSMDYDHRKLLAAPFLSLPGEFGADGKPNFAGFYNSLGDSPSYSVRSAGGLSLRVDHDFDVVRFVSISAYRNLANTYRLDEDKTPLPIVDATLTEYSRTLSQEFQVLSPQNARINWLAGAFFYHVDAGNDPAHIAGLAAAPLPYLDLHSDFRTKSGSIFGQGTMEVLPDTHLTLGYRYTIERQYDDSRIDTIVGTVGGPFYNTQGFDKGTWRAALDHQFSPDLMGYVSYNRGIKSGGFDTLSPGSPGYKPEQLDAFEVGAKTEIFDRRIRVNTSAFYYKYRDIQQEEAITGGTITINAAKATLYGLDLDVKAKVTDALTANVSATYLHSKYDSFENPQLLPGNPGPAVPDPGTVGNTTTEAPRFTGHAGATYQVPTAVGAFDGSGDLSYNSGFYWDSANRLQQPAYALVGASIGWRSVNGTYGARLWGKNLADRQYYTGGVPSAGLGDLLLPAPPRTYGVSVSAHF